MNDVLAADNFLDLEAFLGETSELAADNGLGIVDTARALAACGADWLADYRKLCAVASIEEEIEEVA
eukprot:7537173-Lingulodinium_polyedra.AAC.1